MTGTGQPAVERVLRELCEPRGPGFIRARLYDLGRYPGAVPSADPGDRVAGRLFRLRAWETALRRLDRYEHFDAEDEAGSAFVRRPVEVVLSPARKSVIAWAYYYNRPVDRRRRVVPADWAAWLRRRGSPKVPPVS